MLLSKTDYDHENGYGKLHDLEKTCDTLAAPNLYHCETLIRAKDLRGRLDVKTLNANILEGMQASLRAGGAMLGKASSASRLDVVSQGNDSMSNVSKLLRVAK
jgi:hypothetical protein